MTVKTAIIDVGSNSVRYALMDEHTVVAEKELSGTVLADGLFFSGKLSDAAMARTSDAICAFCDKARAQNADEIFIFATEAVRAASNGKEFAQAVQKKCGVPVDVIDGATEAQIGFAGAISASASPVALFDLGGASCEIICGQNGEISYAVSAPIGCVRLHDGAAGSREKAEALTKDALPRSLPSVRSLVGIGGTATALGGMLYCPDRYDPRATHGRTVPREFLQQTADLFFAGENLRDRYRALTPNRARIIGYGAVAALHVLDLFSLPAFVVSERDNIEGYYAYKKYRP